MPIYNPLQRLTEEEAKTLGDARRDSVMQMNASRARALRGLYSKSDAQLRLDQQVHANCTNAKAKVTNEWEIQRAQAEAQAIIEAGGHALPPPNLFRRARFPYEGGRKSRY